MRPYCILSVYQMFHPPLCHTPRLISHYVFFIMASEDKALLITTR